MTQPVLGIVATAIAIALSLGFVSLFDLPTFLGWVSLVLLCAIPHQVLAVVMGLEPWPRATPQPLRGALLLVETLAMGAIVSQVLVWTVGEGVAPPGPVPSQFAVIAVPTTFFLAIMFGGWPFPKAPLSARPFHEAHGIATVMLVASYLLTYAVWRVFFNYGFLQGAPVDLASAPDGLYHAVFALVFYVTMLAGMFLMLHFDLWPLTLVPAIMKQPLLGVVWLLISIAVAAAVMYVTTPGSMNLDPMFVLTRVTAPFIFGTIIVLNMLQNSLFARLAQPVKGIANTLAATVIGVGLAQLYGALSPSIAGALPRGVPGYEYELWLVNALLSVTFPFLIFYAVYFHYWPLDAQPAPHATQATHPPQAT